MNTLTQLSVLCSTDFLPVASVFPLLLALCRCSSRVLNVHHWPQELHWDQEPVSWNCGLQMHHLVKLIYMQEDFSMQNNDTHFHCVFLVYRCRQNETWGSPCLHRPKAKNCFFFAFHERASMLFFRSGPQEFCHLETFNASCPHNTVIVMQSARYGRMKVGRCVKRNLGYVGCAVDVTRYIDAHCSGRQACSLSIIDLAKTEMRPCPDDVTSYLEASYQCLPGKWKIYHVIPSGQASSPNPISLQFPRCDLLSFRDAETFSGPQMSWQ